MPLRRLPTLDGRLTPAADVTAEELESTLQALRQGLSGRAEPGAAPEKAQPAEPETVPQLPLPEIDFLGDSELFTPEEAGPGVIQPQAEAEPVVREDPALRLAPGQRSLAGQ